MIFVRASTRRNHFNADWFTFFGHLPCALEITYLDKIKRIVHDCLSLFSKNIYRVYQKKLNKFEIALNVAKRLKV